MLLHFTYKRSGALDCGARPRLLVGDWIRRHNRGVPRAECVYFEPWLLAPSSPEMEQVTPEMMGAGQMMVMTDPPLYDAMRRAFNRLFLPRAVGVYDDPGRRLVAEVLDAVLDRGT
jgi:hypothetical protein